MRVLILVFGLFLGVCFASADYVAIAKKVSNNVQVKHNGTLIDIKEGHKFYSKDVVLTNNGKVLISFNDGSLLNLSENSYLSIENYIFEPIEKKYDFKLNMKKGVGVFESGKIGKLSPESFSIKVPEGIIGIRGTKFLIDLR